MICDAKTFIERIKNGDRIGITDELTIEHMIRCGCDYQKELEVEYNKYCIKKMHGRSKEDG